MDALSSRRCGNRWTPPEGECLATLHPRTRRMTMRTASPGNGWSRVFYWSCSEHRDGGVCLSIGSVDDDLRGYPRLPTSRRPRGCGPWWGCPWRASQSWIYGQSRWRAPRLKAGAGGCHTARLPTHSPN